MYKLFLPVHGQEPKFGLSQPMTGSAVDSGPATSTRTARTFFAPNNSLHPGGKKLPLFTAGRPVQCLPFISQRFIDHLLLARHWGNGREPRGERQTGNEPTKEAEMISHGSKFHRGNKTRGLGQRVALQGLLTEKQGRSSLRR